MGGIEPARTYIGEALAAGKHVVTANKDLDCIGPWSSHVKSLSSMAVI
ncbi:MAG: hypothetical protein ACLTSZ_16970 [Lachnospiraceae bacterium]